MSKTTRQQVDAIKKLRLPELQAKFAEVTGETTRSPNKTFLARRISEALQAAAASAKAENAPKTVAPDSEGEGSTQMEPSLTSCRRRAFVASTWFEERNLRTGDRASLQGALHDDRFRTALHFAFAGAVSGQRNHSKDSRTCQQAHDQTELQSAYPRLARVLVPILSS